MTQLLNVCVDSLDLRLLSLSPLHPSFLHQSIAWNKYQDDYEHGVTPLLIIEIPGAGSFRLLHHSTRPYSYTLVNPEIADIRIWNPNKNASAIATQTGQLYINFRSKFLQEFGLDVVDPFLHAIRSWFFEDASAPGFTRVSRADLAADVEYRALSWADLDCFVTKARKVDTFSVQSVQVEIDSIVTLLSAPPVDNKGGSKCSGYDLALQKLDALKAQLADDAGLSRTVSTNCPETLYFGRFGSKLYARIYDKTRSLHAQGKEYMQDIWNQAGWDGVTPVIRVEFSLSGDFLKDTEFLGQCDHRNFEWFKTIQPALWSYLTKTWLRHTEPRTDVQRTRWKNSEFWSHVIEAFENSAQQIVRESAPRCPLTQTLEPGLRGYFSSLVSSTTLLSDQVYNIAVEHLFRLSQWIESSAFLQDVTDKRFVLGTDDHSIINSYSDTDFSALVRREVIQRAQGS